MKRPLNAEEILVRMAGLCAGAEQCTADIREKVLKKGFSQEIADKIVEYLVRNKYIDDVRYAKAFAADKVKFSGWGRIKVRMHLKTKRLSDSIIQQGIAYIKEEDYAESLRKVLAAKARSLDLSDVGDRRKLYRHLASRGFESSIIIPEIRRYIATHGNY